VLQTAIAAAAEEKVMLAGVGRGSVAATLERAETATRAGYDAVVIAAPDFAEDSGMQAEVLTYFRAVADRSALPVVLGSRAGRTLTPELLGELCGHPQIIGAIDAQATPDRVRRVLELAAAVSREVAVTTVFAAVTGRMLRRGTPGDFVSAASLGGGATTVVAGPVLKTRTKRVGFQVLAGSTHGMLEAWQAGATGAVPRLSACAPQGTCEVWQAFKDGDPALAAEKQERVKRAGAAVEGWSGIAALKYGCDLNGYFGGRPRLPLLPLTAAGRETMERELAGLKN
jgi:dihydrodipicolinate synthase/N-acetylneuraminate lyase